MAFAPWSIVYRRPFLFLFCYSARERKAIQWQLEAECPSFFMLCKLNNLWPPGKDPSSKNLLSILFDPHFLGRDRVTY